MTLSDENKINFDDADKIIIGLKEIFKHLNDRYKVNQKLNAEVEILVKTLIDQKLVERTIKETKKSERLELAKKMLLKNKPIDEIIEFTELTESEIKDIQKTL